MLAETSETFEQFTLLVTEVENTLTLEGNHFNFTNHLYIELTNSLIHNILF